MAKTLILIFLGLSSSLSARTCVEALAEVFGLPRLKAPSLTDPIHQDPEVKARLSEINASQLSPLEKIRTKSKLYFENRAERSRDPAHARDEFESIHYVSGNTIDGALGIMLPEETRQLHPIIHDVLVAHEGEHRLQNVDGLSRVSLAGIYAEILPFRTTSRIWTTEIPAFGAMWDHLQFFSERELMDAHASLMASNMPFSRKLSLGWLLKNARKGRGAFITGAMLGTGYAVTPVVLDATKIVLYGCVLQHLFQ